MKTVIEIAREAGIHVYPEFEEAFERFAELVRADAIADEREACAKVCEEFSMTLANMSQAWRNGCRESATEIRARGQA